MSVKIIRAAFREIQRLSYDNFKIVYQIIIDLNQSNDNDGDVKKLHGHDKLWRTRDGDVRVIWGLDSGNIVVIKAGLRRDVYDRVFDSRDRTDPLDIEALDIEEIEELNQSQRTALVDHPAYEISLEDTKWNQEEDNWYKFIYGNYYRYSPVLTRYQKQLFDELRQSGIWSTRNWLVQSGPGTGKTVCAALLACELHREQGWNTMLIVPPAVREDLENYSEIKKIKEQNSEGFWLGTFPDWVRKVDPKLGARLATSEEELTALQRLVGSARNLGKISSRDVLLYQAFVLDGENGNNNRNAIFQENRQRIKILRRIPELWTTRLGDRLCNFDVATQLRSARPPHPYQNQPTILIVDEAQDFLLAQLKALIAVREAWENQGYSTYLWLLGDLNQRIQPVDFDWGQLHLGRTIELRYNYRNSRHILKFANQFLDFARGQINIHHGRHLPEPDDPECAVEEGEQVRLLEYPSSELALKFLGILDSFDLPVNSSREGQGERYFLQQSANQVKVLWTNPDGNQRRLEILNAEKAKGREFDACVAFRIFENNGTSLLEDSLQWYTLLTRPRSRLLVVATTEEIERIGRNYFECCQTIDAIDAEQAASWIAEFASGVDVSLLKDNPQETQEKLLKGCDNGHPYLDTYFVLNLAKVESESLYKWEQEAIKRLQKHYNNLPKELENNTDCTNSLKEELENVPSENISLRCLLLRAMNCSWQAVEEASGFQKINEKEYKRLVESIAKDLEHKNLVYEAARVREKIGEPIPKDFPFSDKIANRSGSLVSLLCQAMLDRPFPDALDK
jgi:mRNA-degrading endonuclease RelE of RelBE toxin-antitoxin system